jgi:hypothetical protein
MQQATIYDFDSELESTVVDYCQQNKSLDHDSFPLGCRGGIIVYRVGIWSSYQGVEKEEREVAGGYRL